MNFLHAPLQRPPQQDAGHSAAASEHTDFSTAMLEQMGFPYELPALDVLSPFISETTLRLHFGKHHQVYTDALNQAIDDTGFEAMPLKALIQATAGKPVQVVLSNHAAQTWNHEFYWDSLTPEGVGPRPR